MSTEPEPIGEARRDQSRARRRCPVGRLWWLALLSNSAWLVLSGIVLWLTGATAAVVLLASVFLLGTAEEFLGRARRGWPAPRNLTGHALAAELALLLGLVLARWGGQLSPAADMLGLLLAVIAVALVGGLIPAVAEAVAGSLLLHFLVTPQPGKPAMAGASGAAMLGLLVGLAVVVGLLAEYATRSIRQATRAAKAARLMADADRIRTALLTAVSHDLRPPLTSADAAVSCLRRPGIQLTAERHDQLLATVEASLDRLARVAASLLGHKSVIVAGIRAGSGRPSLGRGVRRLAGRPG